MSPNSRNTLARRGAIAAAAAVLSTSALLGTSGIVSADPYDDYDDDGSYSSSEGDSGPAYDSEPAYAPEPAYEAPEPEPADDPEPEAEPEPQPEPGPEPESEPSDDPAPQGGTDPGQEDQEQFDLGAGLPAEDDVTAPQIDTGDVSDEDLDLTKGAPATAVEPAPASSAEVTEFSETVQSSIESSSSVSQTTWSSSVSQWNSQWVSYDSYYRPIIMNPYRTPLQLIYTYDDAPRIVTVPPLQRVALTASDPGVYNFTAMTQPNSAKPTKVSAGSFSGGGYAPAPGQPMPQKPHQPPTLHNVLVQIKYTNETSKPFRVKQLIDLGDDPRVGGHKVLLDEETPAWGHWAKGSNGERLFEITKSQELPGITEPAESPLPGYDVALVNNEADRSSSWTTVAVVAAAGCGALGLAAVAFFVFLGRRRRAD